MNGIDELLLHGRASLPLYTEARLEGNVVLDNKQTIDVTLLNRELVGEGMYGQIYETEINNHKYALKVSEHPRYVKQELFTTRALLPKYFAPVTGACTDESKSYCILPFIPGKTLLDDKAQFLLSPKKALQVMTQIAKAGKELHQKDIIWRDIKPANIILGEQGIKLIDAGFALHTDQYVDEANKEHSYGSPNYCAPEMLFNNSSWEKSDMYSIGAITMELLTGLCVPWDDADVLNCSQAFQMYIAFNPNRFNLPKEHHSKYPKEFIQTLKDMGNPRPKERPCFDQVVQVFEETEKRLN